MNTSGESSSDPGSEKFNDLLLGELIELFWSESSEAVLVESLFLFLDCGHLWSIIY